MDTQRKSGRPKVLSSTCRVVTFNLESELIEKLSKIGRGNRSAGIRWLMSNSTVAAVIEEEVESMDRE